MNSKFTVAVVAPNGISGTEKAAVLYAVELARRGHRILFVAPSGPRDQSLEEGNVRRLTPPDHAAGLAELFRTEKVDLVHQHVPGYPMQNPIYEAMRILGEERPPLIETNVFGRMEDPEGDRWVDFRCFISLTSGVQAFRRKWSRVSAEGLRNQTVVFYPVTSLDPALQKRTERSKVREELGIRPEEILILRFGRPGHKWNRNEVRVFQQARRHDARLRILLMEPSPDIWQEVESGRWGEGILLQKIISDFDRVAAIYTAGDLMLHMSDWGESFGYTLAEAMQNRLPLIVNSTPWGDNAQVELVEHGTTGFVCNSCAGAAEALLRLARAPDLRQRFGAASAERIYALADVAPEADLLEEIMEHLVHGAPLRKVLERNRDFLQFASLLDAREKRVLELEVPSLRLAYGKGLAYSGYRQTRATVGRVLRAVKAYRRSAQ
jgi:glycosyltransferase involved in cell wall biosynthesis